MLFKTSQNICVPIKIWTLVLLVTFFSCYLTEMPVAFAVNKKQQIEAFKKRQHNIERQKQQTRQKIEQIKKQEYAAISAMKSNQYKLDSANASLRDQQYRLSMAKDQLDKLEQSLVGLNEEQKKLKGEAAKRIRQIYKGERLSLLHMVLSAKDITTFLDNLYYQQRMVKRDREILEDLKEKTRELIVIRENLKKQKERIISTINSISGQKAQIAIAVNMNRELVNKLKTDRNAYESAERELSRLSGSLEAKIRSLTVSGERTVSYTSGAFIKPVMGAITSPYGWRRHPIFGGRKFHTGVDIAGKNRSPIKAANSGKVIYTGWYGGYGKVVIVDHGKSITTLYAHMSSISVSNGQKISKGTVVGYEGSTGYSTGPHLHFEVRINGTHTNPMGYIR